VITVKGHDLAPEHTRRHFTREGIEPHVVYTLEEARQLLVLSETTFRLLLRRGEIKGRKAGRQWRFLGSDLLEFFRDGDRP
jgi:excisionase family DNA binding protein